MLAYHRTSILSSQAQTVVNTVNTVGVMGKGLASAFKVRYPEMFKAYRELCREKRFAVGQLWLWKSPDQWILNFPTKKHWRNPSKLSYIEAGLQKFVSQYEERGIREIAFPRLGCGNGGLDWKDVKPLMEDYLSPLPIVIYIHDFEMDIGIPEHGNIENPKNFERSFNVFIHDMDSIIHEDRGSFYTTSNNTPYKAAFDSDKNLVVTRPGRRGIVTNEDLYELWTLLLRGPLTRRKLPGSARDSAYYIFPILSQLPYIRPVLVARKDDPVAIAMELLNHESDSYISDDDGDLPSQGNLEWA